MSYQPRLLPGSDPIRRVLNVNTLQFHYTFCGSVRITLSVANDESSRPQNYSVAGLRARLNC